MNGFVRLHALLLAAGIPIDGVRGTGAGDAAIDYSPAATAQQRTDGDALLASFDWSPALDDTFVAQAAKTEATNSIDYGALQRGTAQERLIRALALVVLDEVNALRSNAGLGTRSTAQLVNAIKTKVAETGE
jgi:hypothetical protein